MNKNEFWPKEGKLRKGLIILAIVIVSSLTAALLEEKNGLRLSKKVYMVIAFLFIAIWIYQPGNKNDSSVKHK